MKNQLNIHHEAIKAELRLLMAEMAVHVPPRELSALNCVLEVLISELDVSSLERDSILRELRECRVENQQLREGR